MKHPSILFALIALAAGIVASGFIGVCTVNGESLRCSFSHEFQKQREGILPSLAHADACVAVMRRVCSSTTVASRLDRDPCRVGWRPLPGRAVAMLRLMAVAESAGFTLSRITGFQVAATYDGNMSAVASAVPERRLEKTEDCPLSETLSGHIDDSGLVVAFTAHGGHAENQFVQVCLSRSDLVDRK